MKKKEYVDAVNEIKVDNDLKERTINKITQSKKHKNIYSILASSIIVFVIVISIAIPMINNKNKVTPIEIVEQNNGLPKLENFENLYNIMKNKSSGLYETNGSFVSFTDSAASSETSSSEFEKDEDDYSKTNVQVDGVDEADIVKTDGSYIYYITSGEIIIVNATELKKVSEISYNEDEKFNPLELYIRNNKLIVIGQKENNYYDDLMAVDTIYPIQRDSHTTAKVYNIENKANPKLDREVEIEGSYISSRMIDDNVYFIADKYIYI